MGGLLLFTVSSLLNPIANVDSRASDILMVKHPAVHDHVAGTLAGTTNASSSTGRANWIEAKDLFGE